MIPGEENSGWALRETGLPGALGDQGRKEPKARVYRGVYKVTFSSKKSFSLVFCNA